jgi:heme/copper-type cytochrome/quinol oxidase subunit 2
MNKQRKNILLAYVIFLCVLMLFFFIIVSYAIHEKHIAGYGDIFHSVADTDEAVWIRLAIVALVNLFAFSSIIFAGLLLFLKKKGGP